MAAGFAVDAHRMPCKTCSVSSSRRMQRYVINRILEIPFPPTTCVVFSEPHGDIEQLQAWRPDKTIVKSVFWNASYC